MFFILFARPREMGRGVKKLTNRRISRETLMQGTWFWSQIIYKYGAFMLLNYFIISLL